ncbi:MAG: presqualene diphosphate synthase HpnD [Magnetococcales bacterium]|nr:presqualene diphosphate synthase HpnD [Magnetococcales bacterium]
MTPAAYCRDRTLKANSSFYYPIRLLSPPRRAAMYALYAFCREVDDTVDEGGDPEQARERLNHWRDDLNRAFARTNPEHPVCQELAQAIQLFKLPTQPFHDIIDGMEMDLDQPTFKDQEALSDYCHKVAVAVGLITLPIFCRERPISPAQQAKWDQFAFHLGMAFQLTNILRDIKEDGERGRVYIPQNLLLANGLKTEDILAGRWSEPLGRALTELGALAETHFQAGEGLIQDKKERKCLFPALVMSAIYHRYLTLLKARKFDSLTRPVQLTSVKKLILTLRFWLKESFPG